MISMLTQVKNCVARNYPVCWAIFRVCGFVIKAIFNYKPETIINGNSKKPPEYCCVDSMVGTTFMANSFRLCNKCAA